ncbi:MAG: hypothetical protein AB7N65_21225 [Vicinamibacterales bacterium]
MLVVCQNESLSDRFRRGFDGPPAFALEFVSPAEYARRVALGTADTDVIVLDASAVAPSGFDVHRVLQPRMAAPPVLVLRLVRRVGNATHRAGGGPGTALRRSR